MEVGAKINKKLKSGAVVSNLMNNNSDMYNAVGTGAQTSASTFCGEEKDTASGDNYLEPITSVSYNPEAMTVSKVNMKHTASGVECYADLIYGTNQVNIQMDNVPSSGVRTSKFGSMFMTINIPENSLDNIQHDLLMKVFHKRAEFVPPGQASALKRVKNMDFETFKSNCKLLVDKHEYEGNVQHRVIASVPFQKASKTGVCVVDSSKFSFMDPTYRECPLALNTKLFLREAVFSVDRVVYRRGEWSFKKTWGLAVTDEFKRTKIITSGMKRKLDDLEV